MGYGLIVKMNNGDIFFIRPAFSTNDYAVRFIMSKKLNDIIIAENNIKRTVFITRNNISSFIVVNREEYDKAIDEY